MKINRYLTEATVKLSKDMSLNDISINEKGKVTYIEPKTEDADGMCPFWALILTKVGQGSEGVRIPKVFSEKMAKRFKIPLHERYSIPLCVDTSKVCPFFKSFSNGIVDCSFETGNKEQEVDKEMQQPEETPEKAAEVEPSNVPVEEPKGAPVEEPVAETVLEDIKKKVSKQPAWLNVHEYSYPLSPNIMMFLVNHWNQLHTTEDAINIIADRFDLEPKVAEEHVRMAEEEYGPIGTELEPAMVEKIQSQLREGFKVTDEMVDEVVKELNLDPSKVDLEQLKMGIKIEQEHGPDRGEDTNITKDDLIMTAKIAQAHLKELPDYYTRLKEMEDEADAS